MNKLILVLRILLGVVLLVFGINKFFDFLPPIVFVNAAAETFFNALANSYVIKTVGLIEVLVGLLLVFGKFIPFALVVLSPISVNIILFHATLDLPNIGPAAFVFLVNTFLIYKYWDRYRALFLS